MFGIRRASCRAPRVRLTTPAAVNQCRYISKASPPPLAFVFDIDGVFVHGPNVIPAASKAVAMLEGNNPFGSRIPFLLLTNGGGVSESIRAKKLTKQLGTTIDDQQILQAHTILKTKASQYADKPILVLGGKGNECREVAEEYGYKHVYTTLDVHNWNHAVWNFHDQTDFERAAARKGLDFSQIPIHAVFVFHDPRNWALDIQILLDIVQSGGVIGGPHLSPKQQVENPIEIVFCNPDLIWKSDFARPRIGQGAFREAFQAVYKSLTGQHYPYVQYGKPTEATYKFAEKVLVDRLERLYGVRSALPPVYMIGDNPESDIAGANGANWNSVLVHTGVYDPEEGPPRHRPTHIAEDVAEAVEWAIKREHARVKGSGRQP
ncbi:HAD-superfamily hydrolase [Schizophyllum commune Tattone D]|nr:HAD-superfamily hydrolase [Schizophyllum commune Tattone D]